MQPDGGIVLSSLRDIVYVFFRHKWKIALFFVMTVVIVTAVTYSLPSVYESDAALLVRIGRENLPTDPSVKDAMVNVTQDRTSEVKSELAILTSAHLAEKTVDAIGEGWILDRPGLRRETIEGLKDPKPPTLVQRLVQTGRQMGTDLLVALKLTAPLEPREEAIKRVMKSLAVDVGKQTNIIEIGYEAKDPALARVVLDTLVKFYFERHLEVFATQVSPEFFVTQSSKLEDELTKAELDLNAFRAKNGISSIDAQKETLLAQISSLEGQLSDCMADADGLGSEVRALEELLKSQPSRHELARTDGFQNTLADDLKTKLTDLKIQETDLASRYTDTHRPLIDLRAQIAIVEQTLAKEPVRRMEVTSGLNANYEAWKNTLETERARYQARLARVETLKAEAVKHKEELALIASSELELKRLERQKDILEGEYLQYREKMQQARISAALDVDKISNVSVVQAASEPIAPIKPRKIRNIGLGVLLGLFGGICLAFLIEFLDDSLNTTQDAQRRLGVPVLTVISEKEFKRCM